MTTKISLKGLRMKAFHGVAPSERKIGNIFSVDVSVTFPCEEALENDRLEGTINYADIVSIIQREMLLPSDLLENVAWRIRKSLLSSYPSVSGGRVTITKHLPPIAGLQLDGASVELEW